MDAGATRRERRSDGGAAMRVSFSNFPMKILFKKALALFRKEKLDAEMAEEMRAHLEMQMAENIRRGMSADEARYAAQREFGGVDQIKERARDQRGWVWFEQVVKDFAFALRGLRRSPGFTAVAVLSLALGIGAGTAVFSLVNAILLRSLPVANPDELRVLRWSGTNVRMTSLGEWAVETSGNRMTAHSVTHPAFLNLREQVKERAEIFGFQPLDDITANAGSQSFTTRGIMVSDNFFSGIGVAPVLGRSFIAGEDYTGNGTCVVICYEWWEKYFARDPGALGQRLLLNGTQFTIVGVLPRGFSGVLPGSPSEFYVPMAAQSQFLYRPVTDTFHWFVRLMARVRPGVGDAQLKAELDVAFTREAAAIMAEPSMLVEPGDGGLSIDRKQYRRPLMLMLGVVGLVMLVACANLAGLSLARGAARQHELAVRAALGAGRRRLIRQSLTESFVLAFLGGGLGVLLAIWGKTVIARLLAGSTDGLRYDFSLDPKVLGFSLTAALITAVLSGLLPALRAGSANPVAGLRSRGAIGAPRLRMGRILVAGQICLSLLLLCGAGLYVRTLSNLMRIDAGFSAEKLLLLQLNPAGVGLEGAQRAAFYAQVQSALAELPGVRGATLLDTPLLSGNGSAGGFAFTDRPGDRSDNKQTHRLTVGETFFATMNIPVLTGREFTAADAEGAPKVVIVNETFVQKYLAGENPVGRTINIWGANWQIVGVSRDAKYTNLKETVPPTTYFPFRQRFYAKFAKTHLGSAYFAVRTSQPPLTLVSAARQAVAKINPGVPLAHLTTQEEVRNKNIGQERLLAMLCSALACLALLLSCVGLYGLMAYHVARRTNEIGVRMALGATRGQIARPILSESLQLAGAGVVTGVPVVLGASRLIASHLYGVSTYDPITFMSAAGVLLLVAALAAWLPAYRAARIDPIVALRSE
jgi:predicted permease